MAEPNAAEIFARVDDLRVRWTNTAIEFLDKNRARPFHITLVCLATAFIAGIAVAFGHLTQGAIVFMLTYALGHIGREFVRENGGTPGIIEGPVTSTIVEGLIYAGLAAYLVSGNSPLLAGLLVIALVAHTLSTFLANEAQRQGRSVRLWWSSSATTALIITLFLLLNQVVLLILMLAIVKACACVYLFLETYDISEQRSEDD